MKQSVSAEWLKLRHSRIGIVLAVLPIISLLIRGGNFYFNQDVLQSGWYSAYQPKLAYDSSYSGIGC